MIIFRLFDVKYGWIFDGDLAQPERETIEVGVYDETIIEDLVHDALLEKHGCAPDWIEIVKEVRDEATA